MNFLEINRLELLVKECWLIGWSVRANRQLIAGENFRVFYERSILIIGAHPDDAVLGAGAFIAQSVHNGLSAKILTLSSGELAGDPIVREEEDRNAAEILGAEITFARLPDGEMSQADVIHAIRLELDRAREPFMVLAHDPNDAHQDHVAVGRAAAVSCRGVANLFLYEGPSTVGFDAQCTMLGDEFWAKKMAALSVYESQASLRNLIEWADSTGRYRSWPRHAGARCEAFRVHHADLGSLSGSFHPDAVKTVSGDFSISRIH